MDRRRYLQLATAGWMASTLPVRAQAVATPPLPPQPPVVPPPVLNLPPLRFVASDIFKITVCLRPVRAAGPRIEAQKLNGRTIIHNYGHGGSGWSLSWGSAEEALRLALPLKPRKVAVIGAGAIGLTTALAAQRAGLKVTIYARERYPFVRSGGATGSWTPDSRVALKDGASADFPDLWERMARRSWTMHNAFLGLPGAPVEWMDHYFPRKPMDAALIPANLPPDPGCVALYERLGDIVPHTRPVAPGTHPFNAEEVNFRPSLTFNIASYAHQLEQDFLNAGGRFVPADFTTPEQITRLPEKVIFNCTGYGAKALWSDDSIIPVRGQIAWLPPQEGAHYGLRYKGVMAMARRDGIIIQQVGPNDAYGWNDANEQPDAEHARLTIAQFQDAYRTA